jgi:hypothetical protein
VDDLDRRLTSAVVAFAKQLITDASLSPRDLGVHQFDEDPAVERIFEGFYSGRIDDTLRAVRNLSPIYLTAKSILTSRRDLTAGVNFTNQFRPKRSWGFFLKLYIDCLKALKTKIPK